MRYVIFYCILFWDTAPIQNSYEMRQYIMSKYCDSTKAVNENELKAKLKYIKNHKEIHITKIDTIR